MIKAFLSHSSKDKQDYIRKVAEYLGRDNIVFDEWTFEEGERTLDEILESLDKTALFVIFISKNSLESEWVRKEINEAKVRLDESRIQKIFPIVIDDQISHDNELIPDWLVKNYNLRPIKRAHVAAKRIQNKLRELSWTRHPELKKRHSMFVGRNDKQEEFEARIHDFDKNKPIVIIATGLAGVGRRTFLHRALYKTNIIESPHKPSSIFLDNNVSIEDFILKLNDLGFVDLGEKITDLSNKSISQKISIIHEIMEAVYDNREVVYIYDDGCLINYQREVTEWFKKVIDDFDKCNFPIFAIASKYKVNFKYRPREDNFYFVDLNELNPSERKRLFIQLLELYKVSMAKDNFDNVCNLLFGLPDQIMFAVDLIKEDSGKFIDKLPVLAEFNTDKASVLLKKYELDEVGLNFIRLLAQFEIISSNFIFSIVDESEHYIANYQNSYYEQNLMKAYFMGDYV